MVGISGVEHTTAVAMLTGWLLLFMLFPFFNRDGLRAGDIVTIPPHQIQNSRFVADTKLVYIFFGHRLCREDEDS